MRSKDRTAQGKPGTDFLLRPLGPPDFKDVLQLSLYLNTLNLPHDKKAIKHLLQTSEASFSGRIKNKAKAIYVFGLEDLDRRKIIGVSMIFSQHGSAQMPHLFFQLRPSERHSKTLNATVNHTLLELHWDKNGPTELGGLVVDPAYRDHPLKLGRQLSMIRLKYIVEHPQRFKQRLLVELLPKFRKDGSSPFWDEWGGRFIPLSYKQADLLSRTDKEFITSLFPRNGLYLNLLSKETQSVIGRAGGGSIASERFVKAIGFKYLKQVDVFDGGPHYGAAVAKVAKGVKNFKFTCAINFS